MAVREFPLGRYGFADYLLYVDGKAAGVIEAKKAGTPLTGVELQTDRIVNAIDKHLTDLDAGVAALKRVQANLKRYRASVLKVACEGRLAPTEAELAKTEGRDFKPADKLLERTRQDHASFSAKQVPLNPEPAELFALPGGWCWSTLGNLLIDIQAGKSFRCLERPPQDSEVGVVKVSAVQTLSNWWGNVQSPGLSPRKSC